MLEILLTKVEIGLTIVILAIYVWWLYLLYKNHQSGNNGLTLILAFFVASLAIDELINLRIITMSSTLYSESHILKIAQSLLHVSVVYFIAKSRDEEKGGRDKDLTDTETDQASV